MQLLQSVPCNGSSGPPQLTRSDGRLRRLLRGRQLRLVRWVEPSVAGGGGGRRRRRSRHCCAAAGHRCKRRVGAVRRVLRCGGVQKQVRHGQLPSRCNPGAASTAGCMRQAAPAGRHTPPALPQFCTWSGVQSVQSRALTSAPRSTSAATVSRKPQPAGAEVRGTGKVMQGTRTARTS